jgi:hypothetical protein
MKQKQLHKARHYFLLFICILFIHETNAQGITHRLSTGLGIGILPYSKHLQNEHDPTFEGKNWYMSTTRVSYSIDKWPVEIFYQTGLKGEQFKIVERGAKFSPSGPEQLSKFIQHYSFFRFNYGFNVSLFKPIVGMIMEEPKQGFTSTNTIQSKRNRFNPFIGLGVSYTRLESGLRIDTIDYNKKAAIGDFRYLRFSKNNTSTFLWNIGFDFEIARSRNSKPIAYPSWYSLTYLLRYTLSHQRIPQLNIHTPTSLGQDFLDTYEPYMGKDVHIGQMTTIPIHNWTSFIEICMIGNFNSKANRIRSQKIKEKNKAKAASKETDVE